MDRRLTIPLALCALLALAAAAACAKTGAYTWEDAARKGGAPAKVAVLPFVGRMDVELNIERAVARFFTLHESAVRPGVTYIRLPRLAETTPFPNDAVTPDELRDIEDRIFFEDAKAKLYDILDKTGHDYAIYIQADNGSGGTGYIVAVFDAATRRNASESGGGLGDPGEDFPDRTLGISEFEIIRAIELCFARLAGG